MNENQYINDHPMKVVVVDDEGQTINDHPLKVYAEGGGGGGGSSYDFENGLTEDSGVVKLGGVLDGASEQTRITYNSDTSGLYVGPNDSSNGGAMQITPSFAQVTNASGSDGANLSIYPGVAGLQAVSSSDDNVLIVEPANTTLTKYPSSRDDSGSTTPTNFLYTDGGGVLKSAPVSEIGGGGGGGSQSSAVLMADGAIPTDANVVFIAGGTDFTLANPSTGGETMYLINATGGSIEVSFDQYGSPNTLPIASDDGAVVFLGLNAAPLGGGMTWTYSRLTAV